MNPGHYIKEFPAGRLILALWLSTVGLAVAQTTDEVIEIRLQTEAVCQPGLLTLGDIAELQGGTPAARRQLSDIDVADFAAEKGLTVSRELVALRIALGLPELRTRITGPKSVQVIAPRVVARSLRDEDVIAAAQTALADIWHVENSEVKVQLVQPLPTDARNQQVTNPHLDVTAPLTTRPGNIRVKVMLRDAGRLVSTFDTVVSAHPLVEVVVANDDLPRGHILTTDDLTLQIQPTRQLKTLPAMDYFVGKSLNLAVRQGQVVPARYVSASRGGAAMVVRPRDTVRLVARKGGLSITVADAVVLQSGAIGDTVRVRNPRSKKVVSGRVMSASEVEIRL